MRLSISRSRESIWVWLLWSLSFYLVLEVGPFLIAASVLKKTAAELLCAYLACAMPGVIFLPLVWWLKHRERPGVSLKRLASEWGAGGALFGASVVVAIFYSGVSLGLMEPNDALGGLVVSILLSVPSFYFTLRYIALKGFSMRVAGKQMPRSDGAGSPR